MSSSDPSSLRDTNLSSTVGAFSTRIQRKKREKQIAEDKATEESAERHMAMLEAMMNTRSALAEVSRIDLGQRFEFELVADDWQGWPRLTVYLRDNLNASADYQYFRVVAHDRSSKGVIEFYYDDPENPARVALSQPGEAARLPAMLKRCARKFLDRVGEIVIECESKEIIDGDETSIAAKKDFHEEQKQSTITADVFLDEGDNTDLLEQLPQLDSVDSLPSSKIKSNKTKKSSEWDIDLSLKPTD